LKLFNNIYFVFANFDMIHNSIITSEASSNNSKKNRSSCFSTVCYSKLNLKQPILFDVFSSTEVRQNFLHLFPDCLISSLTEELS
jgi:hypothetical protein